MWHGMGQVVIFLFHNEPGAGWSRRYLEIIYPLCAQSEWDVALRISSPFVSVWKWSVERKKSTIVSVRSLELLPARLYIYIYILHMCALKSAGEKISRRSTNAWHRLTQNVQQHSHTAAARHRGWDASLIFSLRKWSLTTLNFRRWLCCCCALCTSSCPTQRPERCMGKFWLLLAALGPNMRAVRAARSNKITFGFNRAYLACNCGKFPRLAPKHNMDFIQETCLGRLIRKEENHKQGFNGFEQWYPKYPVTLSWFASVDADEIWILLLW